MYKNIANIIKSSSNIVFFGGAGVSTESGIPDFRSSDGIYTKSIAFGKSGEDMISKSYFLHEPEKFYINYKENMVYPDAKPNSAHYAIARLERMGLLKAVITQNIDGLHQQAGSKNVIELHGTIATNTCMECGEKYDLAYILDNGNNENNIPKCKKCGSMIRPDIVLYEEELDQNILDKAIKEIENADTLIVGGSSLIINPAAGLIDKFKGKNLIIINMSQTPYDSKATLLVNDNIAKVFDHVMEWVW